MMLGVGDTAGLKRDISVAEKDKIHGFADMSLFYLIQLVTLSDYGLAYMTGG